MSTSEDEAPERITPPAPDRSVAPPEQPPAARDELPSDPDELRDQIAQARGQLGDTVEGLAQKADVKGQVKDKVDEQKETLRATQQQAQVKVEEIGAQVKQRPQPFAIGAVIAALLLLLLLRRSRR